MPSWLADFSAKAQGRKDAREKFEIKTERPAFAPLQCKAWEPIISEKIWQKNERQGNAEKTTSRHHSSAFSGAARAKDLRQKNGVRKIKKFLYF